MDDRMGVPLGPVDGRMRRITTMPASRSRFASSFGSKPSARRSTVQRAIECCQCWARLAGAGPHPPAPPPPMPAGVCLSVCVGPARVRPDACRRLGRLGRRFSPTSPGGWTPPQAAESPLCVCGSGRMRSRLAGAGPHPPPAMPAGGPVPPPGEIPPLPSRFRFVSESFPSRF